MLGAGGVTGEAFHRGVLRALRDCIGLDARTAELLVGTSAGSLIAANLRAPRRGRQRDEPLSATPAATPPASQTSAAASAASMLAAAPAFPIPHGEHVASPPALAMPAWMPAVGALAATARRPWRARAGVLTTSLLPARGHTTEFLSEPLRRRFAGRWAADPLWIVAVQRTTGRRVVFGREDAPATDVGTAVAASCAIPGYFRPVTVDGRTYVDGGVHSPTNADLVRGQDLDLVIVSSPMSVDPRGVRPRLDLSLRLMWHRYLTAEAWRVRHDGSEVVTFEPAGELLRALGTRMMSGRRLDEVEDLAYRQAVGRIHRSRLYEVAA